MTEPFWNDARTTLLRQLWAQGKSSGNIAREFGCTRNTIMGKVQRLRLPCRKTIVAAKSSGRPRSAAKRAGDNRPRGKAMAQRIAAAVFKASAVPARPSAAHNEPVPFHLDLVDLRAGQCRWPHGDGPFTFCGHETGDGRNYCAYHHRLSLPSALRDGHA